MNHTRIFQILLVLFAVVLYFGPVGLAEPVGTAFTYQGRLLDANQTADGLYDFQFKLFDDATVGSQLGTDVNAPEVDVIDGYFTVELDFNDANAFNGSARWLSIGVRPGELEDPCVYTFLIPRQEITPTPYALYAKNGGGGGGDVLWQTNGSDIYYNNGNVGIGTSSPGYYRLELLHPTDSALRTTVSDGSTYTYSTYIGNYSGSWGGLTHPFIIQAMDGNGTSDMVFTPVINTSNAGLVIKANGNVGIGTASPNAKLTVFNPAATDDPTILMNTGGSGSANTFFEIFKNDYDAGYTINQARKGLAITDNSSTWTISTNRNAGEWGGKLRFGTLTTAENFTSGFNDWMVIQSDGNVGIGTTSPAAKLEVAGQVKITDGSQGTGKVLTSDSSGLATWQTPAIAGDNLGNHTATQNLKLNGYWLSGDGGNEGVYVANDGNVGIGTSTPAAKLSVNGDISTASNYKIGGNTVLSVPGTGNTLVGLDAGAVTTGNYNTFTGFQAGLYNTTGSENTFLGMNAGLANTTGNYNTFSGYGAGYYNTTGFFNTFSGYEAGYYNTTGYNNTFSGYGAGRSNTTGHHNTFSGNQAGASNTTGSYNTFSGYAAGASNTTGSGNVFLGYQAGYNETGSNKLYIDNSDGTPLIYGDFFTNRAGINRVPAANAFEVEGNASKTTAGNWLANSDARIKTDVQTVTGALEMLDKVRLVSFKYTDDYRNEHSGVEDRHYLNVIAQEFRQVFPDYVKSSGEKLPNGDEIMQVDTYPLTVYSAAAVQELHNIVKDKDTEIAAIKKENANIKARLDAMESLVSKLSQQEGGIK